MNSSFRPSASIPTACVVDDCSQRQDGEWLVRLNRAPGSAISPVSIPIGTSVKVINGRVVL